VDGVSPAASQGFHISHPRLAGCLWRTYGYEPVVFHDFGSKRSIAERCAVLSRQQLADRAAISVTAVFRSLPTLAGRRRELQTVLEYLEQEARRERWKYVELRRSPIQRSVMLGLAS